jgi:Type II CAAX prenyl endopeptidase Rce1-like
MLASIHQKIRIAVEQQQLKKLIVYSIVTGVFSSAFAVVLAGFLWVALPDGWFGKSAASSLLEDGTSTFWVVAMGVFLIPLIETLLVQALVIEAVRRFFVEARLAQVLISATLFGLGHYIGGGLAHGIVTFFGGILLATTYVLVRPLGHVTSIWLTWIVHATHNAIGLTLAFHLPF